jgi:hypothetical protein
MPQKPVDDYWKERVKSLLGADPVRPPGPRAIWRHLQDEAQHMNKAELLKVGYPPSERSITRIRNDDWTPLSEAERREYREMHWPDTFLRGDLPWEASATALELLAWSDAYGLPRPPISLARWFWRVTQVMPNTAAGMRIAIAVTAATHNEAGRPLPEGLEWWLAYSPWGAGNQPGYERALARNNNPLPRFKFAMQIATGGPSASWGARFLFNEPAKAALYEQQNERSE